MKQKKIKAILFDYDGVLVDSMEDNFKAWQYAFNAYGAKIIKDDYIKLEGMNPAGIVESISRKYDIDVTYLREITSMKEEFYKANNTFKLYKGIEKLVKKLKRKGLRLGLVSGASESRIRSVTPKSFLLLFDVIVAGDQVNNPKPHPEPYQKALQLLRTGSEEAVVIENAPLGIESAVAAGIYCIGICSTLQKEYLWKANIIASDISSLDKKLEILINSLIH